MDRVPYWNISYGIVIDLLAIPVIALLVYGFYIYWKRIGKGKGKVNINLTVNALKIGLLYLRPFLMRGIIGSRIYQKPFSGVAHGALFWGMVLLFLGTIFVFLRVVFGIPVFEGWFNRYFMALTLDVAGVLALVGILFFLFRRMFPPERLTAYKSRTKFLPVEVVLILIIISGFLVEGLRISANGPEPGSVIGNWIALTFLGNLGNDLFIHTYIWWIHGLLALGLIAYIPFSPLVHLVLAPVNSGLANPLPGPKMGVLDFSTFEEDVDTESEPNLGVACLSDFSWKRLLDFETCLWCGRCHEVCPATQTDKPLSPKKVLVSLADNLNKGLVEDELINKSISSDAVYNCTTCAACLEVCPVSINQPKAIMRLRQNLIMEQSIIPDTMGQAHKSLESRQHPFFGTSAGPHDWHKELNVPFFEKGVTEYLLWVGCAPTYEDRAQNIAKAMVEILSKAGISYGILEESRCTGDPGKQMGNEFLFNEIAQQNVEELNSLGVKKIITLCPHCYNSFTRHYPQLGGHYEVIPHSILLAKLIHEGRLNIQNTGKTICYHDPCYLGRRNEIYNEPRTVISKLGKLVEMPRNKANSFCCGGGGGNYWAEEEGTRINRNRAKEGLNTKADLIATACPFCLLMLTDGLKGFTEEQKVFDLAEIIINDLNK